MMPSTDRVMTTSLESWPRPSRPSAPCSLRGGSISSQRALSPGGLGTVLARRLVRVVDRVPQPLLGKIQQASQDNQEGHHLKAEPLARLERGFRRPHQEGSDVFSVLINRLRRTIRVGDAAVRQRRRHSDDMPRKEGVVLLAGRYGLAGRRGHEALK